MQSSKAVRFGGECSPPAPPSPSSVREYIMSGVYAQWLLVIPTKEVLRMRMALQLSVNAMGDEKDA